MKLSVSIRTIVAWLFALVLMISAVGFAGQLVEYVVGYEGTTAIVRLFQASLEANVITWFSSILLFSSALLLALIAALKLKQGAPYARHWTVLALIFLYLSIDEASRIHELTIEPLRELFNASGIFHYAWVIVVIPLLLIFVAAYWRFLMHLPLSTRLLFVTAGIVYVAGAMGMDMVAGVVLTSGLRQAPTIEGGLIIIEELMENLGVALFITAQLLYLERDQYYNEFMFEIGP